MRIRFRFIAVASGCVLLTGAVGAGDLGAMLAGT
jgi:hypothetical protein